MIDIVVNGKFLGTVDKINLGKKDFTVDKLDMTKSVPELCLSENAPKPQADFTFKGELPWHANKEVLRQGMTFAERFILAHGWRVPAIKAVRLRTGLNLLEAKAIVDSWDGKAEDYSPSSPSIPKEEAPCTC